MKKCLAAITIIILISLPALANASAVLIDASGKVDVTIAGKTKAGMSGIELPNGSVIEVKQGKASVLLESGAVDELPQGSKYTVGSATASGKRTDLGSGVTLAMKELSASGDAPSVHGMVKDVGGPKRIKVDFGKKGLEGLSGLYPRGTTINLGRNVTFEWSKPASFKNPVLVIDDARRKRLAVATIDGGRTSFTRATSKLHLKKGASYGWFLASMVGKDVRGKTARFKFSTLSSSEERAMAGEIAKVNAMGMGPDGKELLISQIYFQHGLYDDMVKALKPLYGRTRSPYTKKLLRLGFAKMGNVAEMKKYE